MWSQVKKAGGKQERSHLTVTVTFWHVCSLGWWIFKAVPFSLVVFYRFLRDFFFAIGDENIRSSGLIAYRSSLRP